MRRVLLFCVGILLGLAAGTILWIAPNLYTFEDGWHSAAFTRIIGLGIIVEGALAALGAALCLGRAVVPLTSARTRSGTAVPGPDPAAGGGGPVLPLCGMLFLLAAVGPYGQASKDSHMLEVMDSMPGQFGGDLVDDFRRRKWTEWTFAVLWLVVGGALLATPLLLKPRVWQLGRRMSGVGCGIAVGRRHRDVCGQPRLLGKLNLQDPKPTGADPFGRDEWFSSTPTPPSAPCSSNTAGCLPAAVGSNRQTRMFLSPDSNVLLTYSAGLLSAALA
jgi:hypothetical protein